MKSEKIAIALEKFRTAVNSAIDSLIRALSDTGEEEARSSAPGHPTDPGN